MAQEKGNPWTDYLGNKKSAINEMKYTDDKHTLRVLPPKEGNEENFFSYIVHWVRQSSGAVMPIFHRDDEKCDACRAIDFLRSKKNILRNEHGLSEGSKEIKEIDEAIMSARASKKFDMNIIDRDDFLTKEKTIKIKRWAIGPMLYKPLFEYARDYGSPSHDESGYDLTVKIENKGGGYKEYKLMTAKRNGTDPLTKEETMALNEFGYDLKALREKDFSSNERIRDVILNASSALFRDAVLKVNNNDNPRDDIDEIEVSETEDQVQIEINDDDLLDDKKESTASKLKDVEDDDDDDDIDFDFGDDDDDSEKKN